MKKYKAILPEVKIIYLPGTFQKVKIQNSKDCETVFRQFFDEGTISLYESFMVLFINRANNTIAWYKHSQGGIGGTIADVRLIFRTALECAASGMIVCHNHPSGNKNPSVADIELTKKIQECAKFHDMALLDHIMLTHDSYYSFADEGIL